VADDDLFEAVEKALGACPTFLAATYDDAAAVLAQLAYHYLWFSCYAERLEPRGKIAVSMMSDGSMEVRPECPKED
jgi:hypothetical protein